MNNEGGLLVPDDLIVGAHNDQKKSEDLVLKVCLLLIVSCVQLRLPTLQFAVPQNLNGQYQNIV
jgi:hypothetical protein